MTFRRSPALALVAVLVLVVSPRPLRGDPVNPCELGGSERPADGGIGGTGARPGTDEGAVGGRVDRTRVDVIGTVTGFASICVGRVEVHYASDTPVRVDDRPADARAIGVGEVVELVADHVKGELSGKRQCKSDRPIAGILSTGRCENPARNDYQLHSSVSPGTLRAHLG